MNHAVQAYRGEQWPEEYDSPQFTNRRYSMSIFTNMTNTAPTQNAVTTNVKREREEDDLADGPGGGGQEYQGDGDVPQRVKQRRLRNMLAARRSRQRKAVYIQALEDEAEVRRAEVETWQRRVRLYEAVIQQYGLAPQVLQEASVLAGQNKQD
ncbi:hypothetical protein CYLTODRAFT_488346 [Cylindrobasidium torrendii FP15055 ss-10]|uniref:BZIP domain-containing protein n=1 Tax=Cylindrobasidium torrendii FP15055 ss-10 TaxID=1314674 RepID=A0A0D7BHN3_9AGAR|nr:hypothetical protein CYLTODRAFT_488346 [Cylindrobasidium torrendii FP15055 ss-10]